MRPGGRGITSAVKEEKRRGAGGGGWGGGEREGLGRLLGIEASLQEPRERLGSPRLSVEPGITEELSTEEPRRPPVLEAPTEEPMMEMVPSAGGPGSSSLAASSSSLPRLSSISVEASMKGIPQMSPGKDSSIPGSALLSSESAMEAKDKALGPRESLVELSL